MTEPLSFTDLSPELIDELMPRCDGTWVPGHQPCENVAEWVADVLCCPRIALHCQAHYEWCRSREPRECMRCGARGTHVVVRYRGRL